MTVTLHGTLECADEGEASRVRTALAEHIRLTREETGCVSFDVTPTSDPLVWAVSEEFVDAAAFEAHQERASASAWARQTEGIKRSYTIEGFD